MAFAPFTQLYAAPLNDGLPAGNFVAKALVILLPAFMLATLAAAQVGKQTFSLLRSLRVVISPTEILPRSSSLPLSFAVRRFATFLFKLC